MRRTLVIALALVVLTGACGSSPGNGEPAELEVAGAWTGTEQVLFVEALEDFTAETGITVRYTSLGDDGPSVLAARVDTGRPPDVAILPQPAALRQFAAAGALVPLSEETESAVRENYDEVWQSLGSHEGSLYGVWFKAANKSMIWYDPETFESAGVSVPTTWDDLLAAGDALLVDGSTPISLAAGDAWTLTDWFENIYLRLAGPDLYDQLSRHEIPWNHPSVHEALTVLRDLWARPGFIDGGPEGALATTFQQSVADVFSESPSAAMVYEGDFVASVISTDTDAELGEDADFFEFPSLDGSGPAVVGGGDVAVQLGDSQAASRLMTYLASPAPAVSWAAHGGFISPNLAVPLDAYPDELSWRSAEALIAAGDNFRFDMSDITPTAFGGTPGIGEWKILQNLLLDGDVDAACVQLEAAAGRAYS